jgi:hypothetical protein
MKIKKINKSRKRKPKIKDDVLEEMDILIKKFVNLKGKVTASVYHNYSCGRVMVKAQPFIARADWDTVDDVIGVGCSVQVLDVRKERGEIVLIVRPIFDVDEDLFDMSYSLTEDYFD